MTPWPLITNFCLGNVTMIDVIPISVNSWMFIPLFPRPELDFFHEKCIFWPFCPVWWPLWATPWPLLIIFLSCVIAQGYWPPVSIHTMSIFTLWAVLGMIFNIKMANLTILTPLVALMCDPMTPHYHSMTMVSCSKWLGSSFSPFLDDCHPFCPQKWAFYGEKRIFGHFFTFGDLHERPHDPFCSFLAMTDTGKCSCAGSLQNIESLFIFFHFFSFMNLRCHEFSDLGPFGSFTGPLWVPPHHVCLFLRQTH